MTKSETPTLVSIGMPTYNGEKTICRALDSLLAQDFKDFELIISDNASTDSTGNICQQYAMSDPRVRYYRNERNIGVVANFNRSLHLARGKYFMWAADDDFWDSSFVSCMVDALNNNPDAVLSFCHFAAIEEPLLIQRDPWSRIIRGDRFYMLLRQCYLIPWPGYTAVYTYGFIRRDVLLKCGGMETRVDAARANPEMATLFHLLCYGRFVKVDKLLFYRRYTSDRPFINDPHSQKLLKESSYYMTWWRVWHQHYRILRVIVKETPLQAFQKNILLMVLYISELHLNFTYIVLFLRKVFSREFFRTIFMKI